MTVRKRDKKASPKKSRYRSNQTDPMNAFVRAKIVYESSDDLFGTIKFFDEEMDTDEKLEKFCKDSHGNENFPLDIYGSLVKKIKNAKDKKKLRFDAFDLKVLEQALELSIDHARLESEILELRKMLAWANTAFKDEGYSYDVNLREAGRRLGFTKGAEKLTPPFHIPSKGKKRHYVPEVVTSFYEKLISSGCERNKAVIECTKKFSFPNDDACSRYIRKHSLKKNIPNFRTIR